jgi:hypothetical protein
LKFLKAFPAARLSPVVLLLLVATVVAAATVSGSTTEKVWNENVRGTLRGFRRGVGPATIRPQAAGRESLRRAAPPVARAFDPTIVDPIFFIPPTYGSGGAGARTVAIEDFNGDGKFDLAVTNHCADAGCTSGSVGILLGNGDGTYQPAVAYSSAGYFTQTVAAADLNGDGKLDLALANQCNDSGCTNGSVTVLLGNGDGTFQAAVAYPSGGDATFVEAGDLNADGKIDLVVANYETNNVGVLLGNGNGSFQPVVEYASGGDQASSVTLADLNGDGRLDLAVTNYLSGNVSILLGHGNGTFQPAVSYSSGAALASAVLVGDFNHDNLLDLAVANVCNDINNCTNGVAGVLLGNGNGTFSPAVGYSIGSSSYSVTVADLNGDGNPDLAVSATGLTLLLGVGDGTFRPGPSYDTGGSGSFFAITGDVNGDGKKDLVLSNDCASDCSSGSVVALIGNGNGTFRAPANFPSNGATTLASTAADFNHDGLPDLALAGRCTNPNCTGASQDSVLVLLNAADGTFEPGTSYNSGGNVPGSVATGDFNGDGKQDIVVSNQCVSLQDCSRGDLGVLLGNGDGTFQSVATYPIAGNSPAALAVGDFNGDGKLDVAVVSQHNCCLDGSIGSVNILLGNGYGSFGPSTSYSTGDPDSSAVVVGDFNGDGKLDVAVANANCVLPNPFDVPVCTTGSVGVLLGNGDGSFQAAVRYSTIDAFAFTLTTGDFNGDGKLDLAVGNTNCEDFSGPCGTDGSVAILLGKGDGAFGAAVTYSSGDDTWPPPASAAADSNAISASDLNGDGKLDLVLSDRSVLLGNGDGTFQAAQSYKATGSAGISEVVADLNGDGKPDLVVADSFGVTALLNISSGFQQTTSITLSSSRNPADFHHRVTFTATVTSKSQGAPSGTITFSDNGHALASVSINGGKARFSTSSLDAGVHLITASYSGDESFLPSTSPELDQTIRADTRTRLTSSHNPSRRGQAVTFTAAVVACSGETPTGKVTFRNSFTVLATVELSGGQAALTTSRLRKGWYLIRADYGGSTTDHRSFAILAQRVK